MQEAWLRVTAGHDVRSLVDPREVIKDRAMQPRRRLAVLTLSALAVAACGAGASVTLLTAVDGERGCYLANTTGMLIVDPDAGTAIVSEDMGRATTPVRWPNGYTGRRSWDQVEVLDASGRVVAQTGQRYELLGGYDGDGTWAACVDGVYPPLWPSPR